MIYAIWIVLWLLSLFEWGYIWYKRGMLKGIDDCEQIVDRHIKEAK